VSQLSTEAIRRLARDHATVDLPTGAKCFGIGRTLAYELASRDEFPTRLLRLGNRYRVPMADVLRALGIAPDELAS
jgi:predicted DNA-binding transcriptional regulator AlpA